MYLMLPVTAALVLTLGAPLLRTFGLRGTLIRIFKAIVDLWWTTRFSKFLLAFYIFYAALIALSVYAGVAFFSLSAGGEISPAALPIVALVLMLLYHVGRHTRDAFRVTVDDLTVTIVYTAILNMFVLLLAALALYFSLPFIVVLDVNVRGSTIFHGVFLVLMFISIHMIYKHVYKAAGTITPTVSNNSDMAFAWLVGMQVIGIPTLFTISSAGFPSIDSMTPFALFLLLSTTITLMLQLCIFFSLPGKGEFVQHVRTGWSKRFRFAVVVLVTIGCIVGIMSDLYTALDWLLAVIFLAYIPWYVFAPRSLHAR